MLATRPTVHGKRTPHLNKWQAEQAAKAEYSKITYKRPHFDWRSKDTAKYRAGVTVYLTLKDNQIHDHIYVVISRSFYRGGERRYSNVTLASLKRLSSIAPLPLLSADQFAAIEAAAVAQEMLSAGHAQQERTVKCPVCGKWARQEGERYYHLEVKSLATGERVGDKQLFCVAERISPIPDTERINAAADLDIALAQFELARQEAMESGTARVAFISK